MNEEFIVLTIRIVGGELSLLNSHINKINDSNLGAVKSFVDGHIDLQLETDFDIRETNTYKEVFDSRSSIDWQYYRYITNDEGDGLCMGILK